MSSIEKSPGNAERGLVVAGQNATALCLTKHWGIDELSFDTVAVPAPGPGQVLVRLKAVSLNYRDLLVVRGTYAPYLVRPRVLGSDGAGEVVAVGEGVAAFAVGDRVAGSFFPEWIDGRHLGRYHKSSLGGSDTDGVLVTARLFDESGLVRIPAHLSCEEAATLPCAAVTPWHALVHAAHLYSGQTVLVLGTGGVSIFGLQFAKLHCARVIITSSSDKKLRQAEDLGATGRHRSGRKKYGASRTGREWTLFWKQGARALSRNPLWRSSRTARSLSLVFSPAQTSR